MGQITQAIWTEVWTRPGGNISAPRRDLQRAYVTRMAQILETPPSRMPADARSIARSELRDVATRIRQRLAPPRSFDDYTLAHLEEMRAVINKVLEAKYSIGID